MSTLSTRVCNTLAAEMKCKPDDVTPVRVASVLHYWQLISRMYGIGKSAQREIRDWMKWAGFTYHSPGGWTDEAGNRVPPVGADEYAEAVQTAGRRQVTSEDAFYSWWYASHRVEPTEREREMWVLGYIRGRIVGQGLAGEVYEHDASAENRGG